MRSVISQENEPPEALRRSNRRALLTLDGVLRVLGGLWVACALLLPNYEALLGGHHHVQDGESFHHRHLFGGAHRHAPRAAAVHGAAQWTPTTAEVQLATCSGDRSTLETGALESANVRTAASSLATAPSSRPAEETSRRRTTSTDDPPDSGSESPRPEAPADESSLFFADALTLVLAADLDLGELSDRAISSALARSLREPARSHRFYLPCAQRPPPNAALA